MCQIVKKISNIKKSNRRFTKNNLTQLGSHIIMPILMVHMNLKAILCEVKIDLNIIVSSFCL